MAQHRRTRTKRRLRWQAWTASKVWQPRLGWCGRREEASSSDRPSRDLVPSGWEQRDWPGRVADVAARLRVRWRAGVVADAGMATAEYAIATVAAVGFAGLLVVIMRSDEVRELLMGIIRSALHV